MSRSRGKRSIAGGPIPVSSRVEALLPAVFAARSSVGAERDEVHHVPDDRREPVGAGNQPGPRPVDGEEAARVPDRPGDPAGKAHLASAQSRYADDGRAADSHGGTRADAALGGSG